MNAINRLKRDHGLFRSKLIALESMLEMGQETWFVVREITFTLSQQLGLHRRREALLLDPCLVTLGAGPLAPSVVDHTDEQRHLETIARAFAAQPRCSLNIIRLMFTALIAHWRGHMEQQESQLFPTIEDATMLNELTGRKAAPIPSGLHETMTVREVMLRYPDTRVFFEGLFIHGRFEGYDCLDEVAWRHGMESGELLARLDEELAREPAPEVQGAGVIPEAKVRRDRYERAGAALVQAPV